MYSAQGDDGQGDFAAVTVKEGHLEFRFDTGSGEMIKIVHGRHVVLLRVV